MSEYRHSELVNKFLPPQRVLNALTTHEQFSVYFLDAMKDVPGCASVHICVGGVLHPPVPELPVGVCPHCVLPAFSSADDSADECRFVHITNPRSFPLKFNGWTWGKAMFDVIDVRLVAPYFPYIENLLSRFAEVLDMRAVRMEQEQVVEHGGRSMPNESDWASSAKSRLDRDELSDVQNGEQEKWVRDPILDALPAGILQLDRQGRIASMNCNWMQFVRDAGIPAEVAQVGADYLQVCKKFFFDEDSGEHFDDGKLKAVLHGEVARYQYEYLVSGRWYRATATPIGGGRRGAVVMHVDFTEQKASDDRAHYLAYYDSLTGLPNRLMIMSRLQQVIGEAEFSHNRIAVLMLDIGKFRRINDAIGHAKGDLLLKEFGQRLSASVRANDMVGRLGGDRYSVILSGIKHDGDISAVVQNILGKLAPPYVVDGGEYFISSSVGIGVYPRDGEDAETLIKHADAAMYHAKNDGWHQVEFYNDQLGADNAARLELEGNLRHALERNEFVLHYQPQIDIESGNIIGAEALIRWQYPERGFIPPNVFIPLAEESGLIDAIGEWVLNTACAQNKSWQEAGLRPVRVAVNVSPHQFHQPQFVRSVASALRHSGLSARYLELEITESMLVQQIEQALTALQELRALGIELSVDDFGTGYSSLSYLKRFPISTLKIDQSFVREITKDMDSAMIVKAIISMARSLHLKTVAEGVETRSQLELLINHHCDGVQGFLFSHPLPANAFGELLSRDKKFDTGGNWALPDKHSLLVVDDDPARCSAIVCRSRESVVGTDRR